MEQSETRPGAPRHGAARLLAALILTLVAFAAGLLGERPTAAAATGAPGARTAVPRRAAVQTPRRGLYWGAWVGDQITGAEPPWDMQPIQDLSGLLGKGMSLVEFSSPFADCHQGPCTFYEFPTAGMESIRDYGAIPVLAWNTASYPYDEAHVRDPGYRLHEIITGGFDPEIREFAQRAAAWGHPFLLRFDWEMNGNWFPWSEGVNGNRTGEFVAAWRHVHDIFAKVGADNVSWVWCPNVGYEYKYRELYPGNKYVDWTCLDGYNWGTRWSWGHWQSFKQVFGPSYRAIRKVAPSKPVMLGEIASSDYGGSKSGWINEMFSALRTGYSKVRALIWFDVNDRGTHWPIESPPAVTQAFSKGIRSPSYLTNKFSNLSDGPIPPPGP
jgi:Glycosyl hydrolase family 26